MHNAARAASHHVARFSLAIGGPLYDLYRRARLLEPPTGLLERRLAAVVAVTWFPLFLLTLADGKATTGTRVPFLTDLSLHVRLLVALPMLIAAEPLVHRSLRLVVRQFVDRELIGGDDLGRFETLIDATVRMRNSVIVEALLLALSTTLALSQGREHWFARPGMWYLDLDTGGQQVVNAAGWWYTLVSLNLFRFVVLRWYYRLVIWYRFLWRTSRLELRLNPLHPDRAGGLGFLGGSLLALTPVFVAQSVAIVGEVGGRVFRDGVPLERFRSPLIAVPLLFLVVAALPLAFFSRRLLQTRFRGIADYGALSSRYVDEFRARWMAAKPAPSVQLLGSPDIQSLADLAGAYDVVRGVRAFPVPLRVMLAFLAMNAIPLLPLALTVIPLKSLIERLAGILL